MCTGDARETALCIARECGIPERQVFAQMLPKDKVSLVKLLQETGLEDAFADSGSGLASSSDLPDEAAVRPGARRRSSF